MDPVVILGAETISVGPGQEARLAVRVRNQGRRVESYRIDVIGVPASFAEVDPRTVSVLPGREAEVGVMFSVPRGVRGRSPGGALTRWHRHLVCVRGEKRGLQPRADGSCPPGARLREGSEMMHVWFTRDLRSAFAIRAPEPELCAAGLLPGAHCASGRLGVGM